jgi:LacI family transcriptional regulator
MLRYVGELASRGVPVVLIDDRVEHRDRDFTSVGTTNVQGAFDATQHLLRLGRRRIAMVTGPMDQEVSRNRLRGYRRALEEADVLWGGKSQSARPGWTFALLQPIQPLPGFGGS